MGGGWKAGAVMIFLGTMLAAQVLKGGALDKLTSSTSGSASGSAPSTILASTGPAPNASQAALAPAQSGVLL